MNAAVNRGIMTGFSHGLLTSASVLANGPGFGEAVAHWKGLEQARVTGRLRSAETRRALGDRGDSPFDLGVHLNLSQGAPLTPAFPAACLDDAGCFAGIGRLLRVLTLNPAGVGAAIGRELAAQIARVVDAGLHPTHLNGHHYVELIPALRELIGALARRFHIPVVRVARERHVWLALRDHPAPVTNLCLAIVKSGLARRLHRRVPPPLAFADVFCGTAHAGRVSAGLLRRSVGGLRPGSTLEVGLHPGEAAGPTPSRARTDGWGDPLAALRPSELALAQSPQLVDLLADARVQLGRLAWLPARTGAAS